MVFVLSTNYIHELWYWYWQRFVNKQNKWRIQMQTCWRPDSLTLPRLPPTHERLWVLPVFVLLFGDAYLVMYVFSWFVISCFFRDVMFFVYAKIRYLSEGVVPLFHNNLYVIRIYRELCWVIVFNELLAFNGNNIKMCLSYQHV